MAQQPGQLAHEDQGRPALVAGGLALVAAFGLLAVADAGLLGEALQRTVPFFSLLLCVGAGAGVWLMLPARLAQTLALKDGLLGAALLLGACATRHLHGPSWPSLLILALGVSCGLTLRSGAVTARLVSVAAFLTEALPVFARNSNIPSVLALACAAAAVPLLLEGMTRRWRADVQESAQAALDQKLRELDQDARDYRLIAASTRGDVPLEVSEERRRRGSVNAIRETLYGLMELCQRVFDPHTCALFMLDPSGKELKVQELLTKSDFVVLKPIPADKGVAGTVVKKRAPLALQNMGAEFAGVTWYHPPQQVRALLAVPVREGEHLRGLLVCDWMVDRTVTDKDTATLLMVAREIERCMENERAFSGVDREKKQEATLFKASQEFVKSQTVPDTWAVSVAAARQVSGASAGLLLMVEAEGLRVVAVDGLPAEMKGQLGVDDSGVITSVLKTGQPGPMGLWEAARIQQLLGPSLPLAGMESVRIFPFVEEAKVVGALLVLANRRHAFSGVPDDRVQTVTALASLAMSNRRMFEKMETMATTDGLTGLLNHRTFQDRFLETLKKAERHPRPVGLILTDIDHFKNVNDTYGHPVGDEVIRRVSAILKQQARSTDYVARYGGEEFTVVLDETDAQGTLQVAERIRQAVQKEVVMTEMGPLKVTLSLGVSAFPSHGKEKHVLIERADQALYTAKHSGRNRAVIGTPLPTEATASPQPEKA